ncbi:hypothetical protein QA645_39500 [Bradyrhizobium sp. CIAT3101]|uniref:hypothetical protein n=1 Tax=Bradyrhizobium sp. CIAT3101 TaxID=439387 RepID=UPI0024B19860|nr:hypothetical protein [Bradyrhizobium sp. CIAT3101]WFU80500.1 hypothetical protein QA645_39500 [Bradyrhizobium sp. CIAT3101]
MNLSLGRLDKRMGFPEDALGGTQTFRIMALVHLRLSTSRSISRPVFGAIGKQLVALGLGSSGPDHIT